MATELISEHEHHADTDSIDVFGFWLYIMTDCILFASLFATFIVLTTHVMGPMILKNFVDLHDVLIETFALLASNFTFCLAILALHKNKMQATRLWLALTFLLGLSFIIMELTEFKHLANAGFSWDYSGSASAFFTLVGTHGLHVTCGLFWIALMFFELPILKSPIAKRRMTYLGLFWNFLDIIWIFVFSIVYLVGAS